MPIFGWVRDVHGLWKDMQEAKKTRLEIEKIEEEKRVGRITLASPEEVERYDPKAHRLRLEEEWRRREIEKRVAENHKYKDREKAKRNQERAGKSAGCLVSTLLILLFTLIVLALTQ